MDFFIKGIIVGLGLNLLLGPIFIILTQTAIDKGGRAGIFVALGIWFSDFLFVIACYFLLPELVPITEDPRFKQYIGLLGGLILIFLGIKMVYQSLKKQDESLEITHLKGKHLLKLSFQGFLINTINPFSIFFWIGVFTTIIYNENASDVELVSFLIGVLGTIVLFDILKVVLAKKIRKYLDKQRMQIFNKYVGIIFVILGLSLMMRSI